MEEGASEGREEGNILVGEAAFPLYSFVYFFTNVLIFAFVLLVLLLCDSCRVGEGVAASEVLNAILVC